MKQTMLWMTAASGVLAALCAVGWQGLESEVLLSLTITFATVFYHFGMRLAVGLSFDRWMNNRADYRNPWYQPHPWERGLYRRLHVKQWKKHLPTYNPELFDPKRHSWEEIIQAMCQAELVHETILLLNFVPLLAIPYVGAFPVFLSTSIAAAVIDLLFVMIQRYNRPRLVRILDREKSRALSDILSHVVDT